MEIGWTSYKGNNLMIVFFTFQPSIDVCDLIDESYRRFGHVNNQDIDKLRLKYRLKVVQVKHQDKIDVD